MQFYEATLTASDEDIAKTCRGVMAAAGIPVDEAEVQRIVALERSAKVYRSDKYQVNVYEKQPGFGTNAMTWLSIKRVDKEPIHDWRDLQEIKSTILGPDVEAIELYPMESRKVDTANQFHLWCFPAGTKVPIGWTTGLVLDDEHVEFSQHKQRALPEKKFTHWGVELLNDRKYDHFQVRLSVLNEDLTVKRELGHYSGTSREAALVNTMEAIERWDDPRACIYAKKGNYVLPDTGEISVSEVCLAWYGASEEEVRKQSTHHVSCGCEKCK